MHETILIVDDDNDILTCLSQVLEDEGYDIRTSLSGDIFQKGLFSMPDLVLLDKQLPGMDGAAICKSLKENDSTGGMPVILMSAVSGLKAIAEDAGAIDFIEKPFNINELIKKVADIIDNKITLLY